MLTAWTEELNINCKALWNRINTLKWSIQKAFETKAR